jgi:hypothetical protein
MMVKIDVLSTKDNTSSSISTTCKRSTSTSKRTNDLPPSKSCKRSPNTDDSNDSIENLLEHSSILIILILIESSCPLILRQRSTKRRSRECLPNTSEIRV